MNIKLQSFGELECHRPSLSTCFDVVSMFSETSERHQRARLLAIAICQAVTDSRFPKMRTSFELMNHGSKCLEHLLSNGVPVSQVFEQGLSLIGWFAESLPSETEVEEVENFTE